ncbi:RWD domain-containing protein 4 [Anthonomus grandis grandis]|uniref:RWD domain-containing protein 4 n=1 Tax=Anthonomus grandis grandis TaxID=2921223 RepID=UPI0021650BE0|nr:RWD domain-containing protein 4 [Anthonomus grandis grandis]
MEELQTEELEALLSIYEGDECFKNTSPNTFQYKYGESDTKKSFVIEVKWGPNYPDELPEFNLDVFYNKHISQTTKSKILEALKQESEQYLGMSMTYSIFEFVKEKFEEFLENQKEEDEVSTDVHKLCISDATEEEPATIKKEKKEQLTKAQKRRAWNRVDAKGEKPRGWDWVDIVRHLSSTGSKETSE